MPSLHFRSLEKSGDGVSDMIHYSLGNFYTRLTLSLSHLCFFYCFYYSKNKEVVVFHQFWLKNHHFATICASVFLTDIEHFRCGVQMSSFIFCPRISPHISLHTRTYVRLHTHARTYARTHAHTHARTSARTHTYTHTHTHHT